MRLSTKHQGQQKRILSSFVGGLNSASPSELIGENQLSSMVNLEVDNTNGLLRTVKGCKDLIGDFGFTVRCSAFDSINNTLLLFTTEDEIYYTSNFKDVVKLGKLNGLGEVITASWEDGILIASGGKLQYAKEVDDKYILTTIETSPLSKGVFIRSGRVLVFDQEDNLYFSGVGDEENWEQNTNDPSSSLFLQIGYKVGGQTLGMVNLSSDVLILKDNGMVFRLQNEYPDWVVKELGRNIFTKGACSFDNIGNNVVILGNGVLQMIQTTQDYGDMKPQLIGQNVKHEISCLPTETKLRYVPHLNQLWMIANDEWVFVYDVATNSFFNRQFNSKVVDVVNVDNQVYIIKRNAVSVLSDDFADAGLPLICGAVFKTDIPANGDILVKKAEVSITPLQSFVDEELAEKNVLTIGKIDIRFPMRIEALKNKQVVGAIPVAYEKPSTFIADGDADVWFNKEKVTVGQSITYKKRQVYRGNQIPIILRGSGLPFYLNYIIYDKVEV